MAHHYKSQGVHKRTLRGENKTYPFLPSIQIEQHHISTQVHAAQSPTAIIDGSKAIRGGVPICFPQFAKRGPLPQHGFARNTTWTRDSTFTSPHGTAAKFILTDSETTRATHWPFKFEAAYTVTLSPDGNGLTMEMQVSNKDNTPFAFTVALHSYYICQSESVTLSQYDGLAYDDTCDPEPPGKRKIQSGDITFGKEVDRVFFETSSELSLPGLTIKKENLPDALEWNPYVEKAATLKDMPDDDWSNFICIEPARVGEPATVQPGQTWTCSLSLHAL